MLPLASLGFPSLTPLSSFNAFALSLAAYRTGELDETTLTQDFSRFIGEVGQISTVFRSEVRFQELQPPWDELIQEAMNRLTRCEDHCYLLQELAAESNWEQINNRLQKVGGALSRLFETFGRLRELESQRPVLASSPYINELLRCAKLYDRQVLSGDLLSERVAAVSHHFAQLQATLEQSPLRLPAIEQLLEVLEAQETALRGLSAALKEGRRPLPEHPLEILRDCSEEARAVHQEVLDLQGSEAAWCATCEGIVVVVEGTCAECGQPLANDEGDRGVAGLVELATRAAEQGRAEDWAALTGECSRSQKQLAQVIEKARALEKEQPEVARALDRLSKVLSVVTETAARRDGPALMTAARELELALDTAQEAQNNAMKELNP